MPTAAEFRTPEKRQAVLEYLAATPVLKWAAAAAGMSKETLYAWRRQDPEFRAEVDAALEAGIDALEDKARERVLGLEPSDRLTEFLLKAYRPERFKDKQHVEHTGGQILVVETGVPRPNAPDFA